MPQNPENGTILNVKDQHTPLSPPAFETKDISSVNDVLEALPFIQNTSMKLTSEQKQKIMPILLELNKNRSVSRYFSKHVKAVLTSEQTEYINYLSMSGQLDTMPKENGAYKNTAELAQLIKENLKKIQ